LRAGTTAAPLFCFPGVGGDISCFHLLAKYLGPDQGVQGVLYPDLESNTPSESLETLAATCLRGIRSVQPKGPYHLGGYSFGGSVAYEVAQQLRADGEQVAVLALWDSDFNADTFRLAIRRILHGIRGIATWPLRTKLNYMAGEFSIRMRSFFGGLSSDSEQWPDELDRRILSKIVRFQATAMEIHRRYIHKPYDGRVWLFCTSDTPLDKDLPKWVQLARGGIEVVAIPGDHNTMLQEPNVSHLALSIQKCMSANS
jgi:thioesterase domain-containing protein